MSPFLQTVASSTQDRLRYQKLQFHLKGIDSRMISRIFGVMTHTGNDANVEVIITIERRIMTVAMTITMAATQEHRLLIDLTIGIITTGE